MAASLVEDLAALELRVADKFLAYASNRQSEWDLPDFDIDWDSWENLPELPPDTPQFPRQQWFTYPNRRAISLILVDRMMDFDELTDEQWADVTFLMMYGGRST